LDPDQVRKIDPQACETVIHSGCGTKAWRVRGMPFMRANERASRANTGPAECSPRAVKLFCQLNLDFRSSTMTR
jgi:hypothetical protein